MLRTQKKKIQKKKLLKKSPKNTKNTSDPSAEKGKGL